jgi:hypothetical protein
MKFFIVPALLALASVASSVAIPGTSADAEINKRVRKALSLPGVELS